MSKSAMNRLMHRKTTALFDHLVGTGEQCRGQVETERLRGRLIEDKIEFSG
jgi:hypothetical protein